MGDFVPIVIEKGLNARFAQAMAEMQTARNINPGMMSAALQVPSTAAYEKYGWFGAMPSVQEWIGELNAKELENYDYTIKNRDWAVAAPIHENDINDDQTSSMQVIPQMLVRRLMQHQIKLLVDLLKDGDTNTAYDGVAFFSDVSAPRAIDNLLAGTGTTLAQLETDLNAALVAMAKFDDDQDEILNIQGNLIVCPVALERKFKRLVNSQVDPTASVTGTFNPYNDLTVIGDPRLDSDDANDWYLLATNEVIKPFIFQMREEAAPMMEKTPHTKQWVYSADYRANAGYGLPHLAVKTVNS